MTLTEEDIAQINSECPRDQGIFKEPNCVPTRIKELVVYSRYETGGFQGGGYGGRRSERYTEAPPADRMKVLDLVLARLMPNISYLQFRQIERIVQTNQDTDEHYYGNSTDYMVEYIILSELLTLLDSFTPNNS